MAIGIVVLATLSAAVVTGVGVFGEGMMFANQSAASAILVVALHRHGTGSERLVDALVGGGVALVIGVGLFPAEPLRILRDAEQQVLRSLAGSLAHLAALLGSGTPPQAGWTLAAAEDIHQQLSGLAQARMTARANVRIAPRRWHLRDAVAAEDRRVARFDLLAGASLSLIRAASDALDAGAEAPAAAQELFRAGSRSLRARSSRRARSGGSPTRSRPSPRRRDRGPIRRCARSSSVRRGRRGRSRKGRSPRSCGWSVATSCWSCPQARRSWRARRRSSSTSSHVGVNGSATTWPSESDSAATGRAIIDPMRTGSAGASSAPSRAASRSRAGRSALVARRTVRLAQRVEGPAGRS